MYYTARAIKFFGIASIILLVMLVVLSSKAFLNYFHGSITVSEVLLLQGLCANLLSGAIVAVIIYTISYKQQKDTLINNYLKNVIHIIKYSNIKNNELEQIKKVALNNEPYDIINSQEFLSSVGTLETFTKLSRERAFSFAENKDNYYPIISTQKTNKHISVLQLIDNAVFNSPNSIYYTIHYTIQVLENKIKMEMAKGSDSTISQKNYNKNLENANALKNELVSVIDQHKPSLEQSAEELSKLGHQLSELAGKTEQWNSFLATPTT